MRKESSSLAFSLVDSWWTKKELFAAIFEGEVVQLRLRLDVDLTLTSTTIDNCGRRQPAGMSLSMYHLYHLGYLHTVELGVVISKYSYYGTARVMYASAYLSRTSNLKHHCRHNISSHFPSHPLHADVLCLK